jgi:hypothetical protein
VSPNDIAEWLVTSNQHSTRATSGGVSTGILPIKVAKIANGSWQLAKPEEETRGQKPAPPVSSD